MVRFAPESDAREHVVQLFDAPRSLADATARFLAEGWDRGAPLLIIARQRHIERITSQLGRLGYDVTGAVTAGRLRCIDAHDMLRHMRRRGQFMPDRATHMVTELLSAHAGETLWGYGEIVDLLAEEGDFDGAAQLEAIWSGLRDRYAFTLLCGYSAAHFADPRHTGHLRAICDHHTAVRTQSADALGTWLTTGRAI